MQNYNFFADRARFCGEKIGRRLKKGVEGETTHLRLNLCLGDALCLQREGIFRLLYKSQDPIDEENLL
jgi:hypothetical protein